MEPPESVLFHRDDLPDLLDRKGRLAAENRHDLAPLTLDIDGFTWTYRIASDTVVVDEGAADDAGCVAAMDQAAFGDLVALERSVPTLVLGGDVTFTRGDFNDLAAWELSLRAIYAGVPIYDPTRAELLDRDGQPLDLTASFTLDDDPDDLRHFLRTTGYLRVRNVFRPDEIATLNAAADRLAAAATEDDDRSWWATTETGDKVLTRIVYTSELDDTFALEDDERLRFLSTLPGNDVEPAPDRMEGHSLLFKPPGQPTGLADLPWHQDCGLGGHRFICPAVAIGIQFTGSDVDSGCFEVIAGSHGQSCNALLSADELAEMPRVQVATDPGDVTVHIQDVIHASPPPTGEGGRRTLYVTYYPPTLFERIGPHEALNDFIRTRTEAAGGLVG